VSCFRNASRPCLVVAAAGLTWWLLKRPSATASSEWAQITNLPDLTEAFPVPGDHGMRFDDDKRRSPVGPDLAQPCPEESMRRRQSRPLHRPLQDDELMPERQVLQMECGSGFEGCRHGSGQHLKRP